MITYLKNFYLGIYFNVNIDTYWFTFNVYIFNQSINPLCLSSTTPFCFVLFFKLFWTVFFFKKLSLYILTMLLYEVHE